ncbi:hypothetical protein TNCV_4131281 [Trichonephila clavipes]|nr:hypothetical protein TNCV_4131281 [Trichonephila clavipes]
MSPVWCARLRPTTGLHLAPCNDEFRGPRSDYVRQVALETNKQHERFLALPTGQGPWINVSFPYMESNITRRATT